MSEQDRERLRASLFAQTSFFDRPPPEPIPPRTPPPVAPTQLSRIARQVEQLIDDLRYGEASPQSTTVVIEQLERVLTIARENA